MPIGKVTLAKALIGLAVAGCIVVAAAVFWWLLAAANQT